MNTTIEQLRNLVMEGKKTILNCVVRPFAYRSLRTENKLVQTLDVDNVQNNIVSPFFCDNLSKKIAQTLFDKMRPMSKADICP